MLRGKAVYKIIYFLRIICKGPRRSTNYNVAPSLIADDFITEEDVGMNVNC